MTQHENNSNSSNDTTFYDNGKRRSGWKIRNFSSVVRSVGKNSKILHAIVRPSTISCSILKVLLALFTRKKHIYLSPGHRATATWIAFLWPRNNANSDDSWNSVREFCFKWKLYDKRIIVVLSLTFYSYFSLPCKNVLAVERQNPIWNFDRNVRSVEKYCSASSFVHANLINIKKRQKSCFFFSFYWLGRRLHFVCA